MPAVAWPRQHQELAVHLSWKQHGISVKRKKRILNSGKCFKILCPGNAYGRAVKVLAPDYIISIFHFYQSWIIRIFRHKVISRFILKRNLFFIKLPANAILAPSKIDIWDPVGLLAPEYTDKFSFVRHHRTVEDTRHSFCRITSDHRIVAIPP
ncbi:hypothetical protein IMSAGC021_00257 [Muribaculaceae bacterium]|nr:hypothetical protein IMSAGC021_00257 [Muribaculaceae bacterium]